MSAAEHLAYDPTSELWGEHRSRYRFAAQYARAQRTLDVASGAGFGLQMLRQAGAHAIGLDYDAEALQAIKHSGQPEADLIHADATRLPIADASFDLVVSFETLEHVPDAAAMVREIRRVLRNGGQLVLSTPNKDFGPPELHTGNPYHIKEFTAEELRELLCSSFRNVQLFGQRPAPHYRYIPFLMVDRHIEPQAWPWKLMTRLPFGVKNSLAMLLSGRPFYPTENDYWFDRESWHGAHALVAVAQ